MPTDTGLGDQTPIIEIGSRWRIQSAVKATWIEATELGDWEATSKVYPVHRLDRSTYDALSKVHGDHAD